MKLKQYFLWPADLSPDMGRDPGKTCPIVIVQTNLLNDFHPSTVISPIIKCKIGCIDLEGSFDEEPVIKNR